MSGSTGSRAVLKIVVKDGFHAVSIDANGKDYTAGEDLLVTSDFIVSVVSVSETVVDQFFDGNGPFKHLNDIFVQGMTGLMKELINEEGGGTLNQDSFRLYLEANKRYFLTKEQVEEIGEKILLSNQVVNGVVVFKQGDTVMFKAKIRLNETQERRPESLVARVILTHTTNTVSL